MRQALLEGSLSRHFFRLLIVGGLLTARFSSNNLLAAELSIPTIVAAGGETIEVSILYSSKGATVAGLQFDLEYDPGALTITANISGPAAAAGKTLATAVLPNRNLRFLIVGLNQNVIPDGSVVQLTIQVNATSRVGPRNLTLLNAVGSSPAAETVFVKVKSGQNAGTVAVNDFVSLLPNASTYRTTTDTDGCPAGFIGKFSFDARLAIRNGAPPLSSLAFRVATLTGGNLLQNADDRPSGVGAILTIPKVGGYSDGVLSEGESVDVSCRICLKDRTQFQFFVDVLGILAIP